MDALKDSDLLHWKHSLSELIDISIAQKAAIWRLYGRRYAVECQCSQGSSCRNAHNLPTVTNMYGSEGSLLEKESSLWPSKQTCLEVMGKCRVKWPESVLALWVKHEIQ